MAAFTGLILLGLLFIGGQEAAKTNTHTGWTEFAIVCNPADGQKLQAGLRAEGIDCREGTCDLGCFNLNLETRDFDRAQEIAVRLITRNALTLQLRADPASWDYCVWENGRKKCYHNSLLKAGL